MGVSGAGIELKWIWKIDVIGLVGEKERVTSEGVNRRRDEPSQRYG
jgi:hypothetical protein